MNESWNVCRYVIVADNLTSHMLAGVSLLTLSAISVDRLFALAVVGA